MSPPAHRRRRPWRLAGEETTIADAVAPPARRMYAQKQARRKARAPD